MNLLLVRLMLREAAIESNEKFALKLSTTLGLRHAAMNIVSAPVLLQMALTLLYCGAADETANVLKHALEQQYFSTPQQAAKHLFDLFNCFEWLATKHEEVRMMNAWLLPKHDALRFKSEFQTLAEHYSVLTQSIELKNAMQILENLNEILQRQTHCSIDRIKLPDDFSILNLSAINFRLHWENALKRKLSKKMRFYTRSSGKLMIANNLPGICIESKLRYANWKALRAKAIELPFEEACLKMLIVFPNEVHGLSVLEQQLKHQNLTQLISQMQIRRVRLTMPLINIEFNCELKAILSELGLINIFSRAAKFPGVFKSSRPDFYSYITSVQQEIKLELNATGTQYASNRVFSNPLRRLIKLKINHPFYFMIKSDEAILLAGHIVNF